MDKWQWQKKTRAFHFLSLPTNIQAAVIIYTVRNVSQMSNELRFFFRLCLLILQTNIESPVRCECVNFSYFALGRPISVSFKWFQCKHIQTTKLNWRWTSCENVNPRIGKNVNSKHSRYNVRLSLGFSKKRPRNWSMSEILSTFLWFDAVKWVAVFVFVLLRKRDKYNCFINKPWYE